MNRRAQGGPPRADIRIRLGLALVIALAPVLLLSGMQSALIFQRDAADKRAELVGQARSAAQATRVRLRRIDQDLRALATSAAGYHCVDRLDEARADMAGAINLIRFDESGRVACAAAPVPIDAARRTRSWFRRLVRGNTPVIAADAGGGSAVLAAARLADEDGHFAGAMAVLAPPASLGLVSPARTALAQPSIALTDAGGQMLASGSPEVFPASGDHALGAAGRPRGLLWLGGDRRGESRLFAAARVTDDLFVVVSAPSEGLFTWARLNPLSAFVLPLLAFFLALGAVALVAERGVVRWILYLRRIAELYAGGKYGVRPTLAPSAPGEIRQLAQALGDMAGTIAERDAAIKQNMAAQETLMREIHHRVKNNLQVISSLLNLQQRSLTDSTARATVKDTRQRILALSVIYRTLYEGPDLRHVDLAYFVNDLVAQLLVENRDLPSRTRLDCAPLEIDPDRLAPLALFIVEAVANIGRKEPGRAAEQVEIHFRPRGGEGELYIVGGAPPAHEAGLGGTLMKVFARQLAGEVTYPTGASGDGDARLVFPLRAA